MKINKFFTIVLITVIIGAFYACIINSPIIHPDPDPDPEYDEPGIINLAVIHDGSPLVDDMILLDRADPDMPQLHIILENPWLYDEDSITWRVSGTAITESGPNFFIDAYDPAFNNLGFYYVNVSARISGVPFSRTFTIIVTNSADEDEEEDEEDEELDEE